MADEKDGGDQPGDPDDVSKISMYLGPYEAWNFGVGRGYALPVLRKDSQYYTALTELDAVPKEQTDASFFARGWLPTMWEKWSELHFLPFVVRNPIPHAIPTTEDLAPLLHQGLLEATRGSYVMQADPDATPSTTVGILTKRMIDKSRYRVAFPIADEAMHSDADSPPPDPKWQPDTELRGRIGDRKITVIAVIDDGLPFAHRSFRDASGKRTRVEFCWLQSAAIDEKQESVLFGREYVRQQIENLIAQHGDDEDTLYRKAGATTDTEELGSLIDRHATHGAHVMDLAAGYAAERGRPAPDGTTSDEEPREEIRIIAVQLPNTIAWDTSGFGKDMYMLSAFHYIFHRADIIAKRYGEKNLRLVINFSYGFSGGRHDGETELEAAIDELVCKRRTRTATTQDPLLGPSPTALVLPAGNTFLDRLHGIIYPNDFVGDAARFHWRIQPNDRTPSYLELWFWNEFNPHGYQVQLLDPWGEPCAQLNIEIPPQSSQKHGDPGNIEPVQHPRKKPIGQISVDWHRAGMNGKIGRYRVLIVVAPTEPEDPTLPRADAGRWTVVINRRVAALIDQPIHCWIQRSADPESLRSGSRQSYFEDCAYEDHRFTPQGDYSEKDYPDTKMLFVRRFGSLNGLATGRTTLVVGGYRLGAGLGSSLACARPARYSSAGVIKSKWPEKQVDASSMSDRSRVLPGTIAAGVRSGSLSLMQGTSSAAPFVARQLAEIFADSKDIEAAPSDNYLSLLKGYKPPQAGSGDPSRADRPNDALIRARLGKVRVPPHWQPGIDRQPAIKQGGQSN
jgi:hypothetical protein